jgi:hypothetical protein
LIVATDGTVTVSVTVVVVGVVVVVVVVEGPVGVVPTVTVGEGTGDVAGVGGEGSVVGVGAGAGDDAAGVGGGDVVEVVVPPLLVVGTAGVETGADGCVVEVRSTGRGPSGAGAFGAVPALVVGGRRVAGSSNGRDEFADASPESAEAVPADVRAGLAAELVGAVVGAVPGRAFVATKSVRPPSDGAVSFCTNPT